jgi:DNA polymerase I-like protein with 3'-5' exonuclease and polymerase domains
MSTEAQIAANQANSQLSTGPVTEEGKSTSARNNTKHGLTYKGVLFFLLPWENADEYIALQSELISQYLPMNATEMLLVERLAQHHWLRNRAMLLQGQCFSADGSVDDQRLALYLRYQTTHERAFHKLLQDLLKLQDRRHKEEIGFESQKQKAAEEARQLELHDARVRLANARASHLEIDSDIRQTCEAALPGRMRIPFNDLCGAFRTAIQLVSDDLKAKQAA